MLRIGICNSLCGILFLAICSYAALATERTVLKEEVVRQVITDYLRQKTAQLNIEVRLKKLSFVGELPLPPGNVSYEVVSSQEWEGWGKGALALVVRVDDRLERNIPINVEVEALADMVVTTRPLEWGAVVKEGDVALQKRDLTTAPARVCRSIGEALGKRVRMGMRGNAPVREDSLERLPIVKSGQLVTIIAENNAFRVTATGKAKGNGAAGDMVLVQNLNAQKDVPAVVVDANTVRVEF